MGSQVGSATVVHCNGAKEEQQQLISDTSHCNTSQEGIGLEDFKGKVHFQVMCLWISEEMTEITRWHLII